MTCNEYQEWISEYVDGELHEERSVMLFRHLSECRECRKFLRATLELRSLVQDDILLRDSAPWEPNTTTTQHFSLALPLVAILFALFLWVGISQNESGTLQNQQQSITNQNLSTILYPSLGSQP